MKPGRNFSRAPLFCSCFCGCPESLLMWLSSCTETYTNGLQCWRWTGMFKQTVPCGTIIFYVNLAALFPFGNFTADFRWQFSCTSHSSLVFKVLFRYLRLSVTIFLQYVYGLSDICSESDKTCKIHFQNSSGIQVMSTDSSIPFGRI